MKHSLRTHPDVFSPLRSFELCGVVVLWFLLYAPTVLAQTTYTWNATSGGSWLTSTNWTPNRTVPASTDILVFSTGGTYTVTDVPTETIGQLIVSSSTSVNFQAWPGSPPIYPSQTLTIGGGTGTDLNIGAGSQLKITPSSINSALSINMVTGTTGTVAGSVVFATAAKLLPIDASALQFVSGSSFTGDTGFTGNPFGTTALNAVVFQSGSTYVYKAGSNPFGASAPNSVTVFQSGSLYSHQSNSAPSFSGRTYANIEMLSTGSVTTTGSSALTIDNLTVSTGTLNVNLTTTVNIKGDIAVANGATLNFNPATASTLTLNGSSAQSISGTGTVSLSAGTGLTVNNSAGCTLLRPLAVNGTLTLTNGLVTTSSSNLLSLGSAAIVSGGNAGSFVNGPMTESIATSSSIVKTFPVGRSGAYRPVDLTITQDAATATDYTIESINGPPPGRSLPSTLNRVSSVRYFSLSKGTGANVLNGTIKLSYESDDLVTDYAYLRVAEDDGTNWIDLGGVGTANTTGTIASTANFTSLSLFVLANNTGGVNPLPVELTAFKADRLGSSVLISWQTISELNSREFIIERKPGHSATEWDRIGSVPAYGTSDTRHAYEFEDRTAGACYGTGDIHYRLRQVDRDGSFTYSPIVAIAMNQVSSQRLEQNRPNPFNAQTTISFTIPNDERLILAVTDIEGREVVRLADGVFGGGIHAVSFSSGDFPSGLYFYSLTTSQGTSTKRMLLLK